MSMREREHGSSESAFRVGPTGFFAGRGSSRDAAAGASSSSATIDGSSSGAAAVLRSASPSAFWSSTGLRETKFVLDVDAAVACMVLLR